jgi:ABC-2 type transport system ATP-binding protein
MMNSTDAATTSVVEVSGLRVVRGGRVVLPGLSTTVPAGQITGLLGPSGCGKTTLMRCIVGVQKTQGGSVRVLGEESGSPALRRRVGYMTQAPSVYDDLTVRENLRFFASVLGAPGARSDTVIDTVGLGSSVDSLAGRLSGGERSRVSLAVAMLSEPAVMVLDEPTVGLDPVLRRQLWGTFAELARAGATIIVSSHVMDEAARCDRLMLMRDGELIADDEPASLLAHTGAHDIEAAFLALVDQEARP